MIELHIQEIAEKRGVTFEQAQKSTGISADTLRKYWEDTIDGVDTDIISKLAVLLHVAPDELFEEARPLRQDKFVSQADDITWL